MNILFVTTFYWPNMQGGVEQVVKRLAESLTAEHNVAVYCCDERDGTTRSVQCVNGVRVYRASAHRFQLFRFSYQKSSLGKLEKVSQKMLCYYNHDIARDFAWVCDSFQPDLIHTHTLYGIPPVVWKWAKQRHIPTIHMIHDITPVSPVQYGHRANFLVKKVHKWYMNRYSRYVDVVTAPSQYTLDTSLAAGCFRNAKIRQVVANAVEIDREKLRARFENKTKDRSDKTRFVFAGRLVYFKGIKTMLRAFDMVQDENLELHICGDGELREYVQQAAARDKRIVYHGKLALDALYAVYGTCDVLIVPSEWPEPFGMVLIEGNANGLPVIATRCGGMTEMVEAMHSGCLYDAGDVQALRDLMVQFSDRDFRAGFYPHILQHIDAYNFDHQLARFERLYRQIHER